MGVFTSTSQKNTTNKTGKSRLRTIRIENHDLKLQQIKDSFFSKVNITASNDVVQKISNQLNQHQLSFANSVLRSHYIFKEFKEEQRKNFAKKLYKGKICKNSYIFKQNQKGDKFYIVYKGKVDIQNNSVVMASFEESDSFGQLALIYHSARTASAKSVQDTTLFIMDTKQFKYILREINVNNAGKIKSIIGKVEMFSFLSLEQKASIAKYLIRIPFKKGQKIFQKGELSNYFYIIQSGQVKISIPGNEDLVLSQYQTFGQNCFSPLLKRAGSAYCISENTFLLMLGQKQIQRSLGDNFHKIVFFSTHKWALSRSSHFNIFNPKEIQIISCLFTTRWSGGNQILMQEGFHPDSVVICLEGTINGQIKGSIFCDDYYGKKDLILDKDIIKDDPGLYSFLSFKQITNIWKQLQYSRSNKRVKIRDTLSPKLSRMLNIKFEDKTMGMWKPKCIENKNFVAIDHLQIIYQIQKNDWKSVWVARNQIKDNELYIVKIINKSKVIQKNMQDCILNEKKILETIINPYTIKQFRAFIDSKNIFFVYKYHNGISLEQIIQELGSINILVIQTIMAFLVVIFECFQRQNLIYRNLKTQKIFLNSEGKICINDFSHSKIVTENQIYRTYTILGTPHYMAPQMLQGRGYNISIDYWSLGVLMYYLIYAVYPFGQNLEDPIDIYRYIQSNELQFPETKSDSMLRSAKLLISQLLDKQPHQRIPGNDFELLKKHQFFEDMNFEQLSYFSIDLQQVAFKISQKYNQYRRMPGKNMLAEINYEQRFGMPNFKNNGVQIWNDYLI